MLDAMLLGFHAGLTVMTFTVTVFVIVAVLNMMAVLWEMVTR